jgi:hypothetical protein
VNSKVGEGGKAQVRFSVMMWILGVGAAVSVTGGYAAVPGPSQSYEYVPQQSCDFNGEWDGVTTEGSGTSVQFTIRNNMLVSASCQSNLDSMVVVLSTPVMNGEFSANAHEGFGLSGRIVSASQAIGQITAGQCLTGGHPWRASKRGSLLKTPFLVNAD